MQITQIIPYNHHVTQQYVTDLFAIKIKYRFKDVIKKFIASAKNGDILTPAGDKYAEGSLRVYSTLLYWIEKYESTYDVVYLNDVNPHWVHLFIVFQAKYKLSKNAISQNVSKIKALLKRAYLSGITPYSGLDIPNVRSEKVSSMALNTEDLVKLAKYDFSDRVGHERIRDLFVMNSSNSRIFLSIREFRRYAILLSPVTFLLFWSQFER